MKNVIGFVQGLIYHSMNLLALYTAAFIFTVAGIVSIDND